MSGTRQVSTNMAFKDLSGASQARSGRRAKLWKVKKLEEKLEKSDREKETTGDRRKRSIRHIGGGGGGGGRERRREKTFTNINTNSNDNNNNNNNNNNSNSNSNNNITATTNSDNTINKEWSQAEEGQKQYKRRRRRKSENDLQDTDTFSSGTSIYVPAAAGRVGALLARARRALSERRQRSVSQGPQRALSSSSHEISLDEPPSDGTLVYSRAGRSGGVAAAWVTPSPCPDAPSGPSVRRRGSLDSLGYPASAASTSLGMGSASSLDQTMTRSLGSRGSLCDEAADECDNINVVVRCRPLNEKEKHRCDEMCLQFPGEGQAWVNMDNMNGQAVQKPKVFTYNVVFEPEATQEDVLAHSGVKRLLDMAIDGFSCTVFCYGQTGSGKTHTLTGPPHLFDNGTSMFSESHGLIFRSFVYLFNQLQNRDDMEFTLTASYLEIYNEKVIDLLNIGTNTKPLQVRWSKKKRGFFVENLFEIECSELDDLLAVLEEGLRNRAVASHNMNEYSSRSHTILTVNITSEQKADDGVYLTKNGKINFVDLAGSEMTKKTNSEGKTLEEANNINKSLMVLGTCIAALSDHRKKDGHIPYRDSKLTKLLADSLAGNGVTLMIACVSPAKSNISETLNTLRYASRAKRIRTKPLIIMDPKEKVILSLQREVSLLREENAHLKMLIDLGENGVPQEGPQQLNGHLAAEANGIDSAEHVAAVGGRPAPGMISRQGSFRIDKDKLETLDNQELVKLVQQYMASYSNIRRENKELQQVSAALVKDQELVCRENERLLRKLEDVNRKVANTEPSAQNEKLDDNVCRRSPIIPAQPAVNGEDLLNASLSGSSFYRSGGTPGSFISRSLPSSSSSSSQVWINPLNETQGKNTGSAPSSSGNGEGGGRPHHLPESINKELEKRRIGKSLTDLTGTGGHGKSSGGRRNSWDERNERKNPVKSKSISPGMANGRSGGRGKTRSKSVPRPKGRRRGDVPGRAPAPRETDHRPPGMRSS
ncbi:kinesin-like protein KIN-8A isoform X3 [Portunus trituberculatus]|uniref:kinesin-like protein KIN-8A isoform X3 n=1 Tax=Portunus trituberculatus TaxID=210409 RepID=UPI001E1CED50|nr:kinesin-like protein KIN-8A isoform X3 [Portunus trituberculatus]